MYVVSVTVFVEPERVDDFVEAILDNARNTRNEPGNVRLVAERLAELREQSVEEIIRVTTENAGRAFGLE